MRIRAWLVVALLGLLASCTGDGSDAPTASAARPPEAVVLDCHPVPTTPDGLPSVEAGTTDRAIVEAAARRVEPQIRASYRAVQEVAVTAGYGSTWSRSTTDAVVVVTSAPDFAIGAVVAHRADCPSSPAAYDGIGVRFGYKSE